MFLNSSCKETTVSTMCVTSDALRNLGRKWMIHKYSSCSLALVDTLNGLKLNQNCESTIFSSSYYLRLQDLALTCSSNSDLGIASVQRGHLLYVPLASHSVNRCSVSPAISTTCQQCVTWYMTVCHISYMLLCQIITYLTANDPGRQLWSWVWQDVG